MEIVKYRSHLGLYLDLVAFLLTSPWLAILGLFCSCYWSTTYERSRPIIKAFHFAILGPFLGVLVATLLPPFVLGYLLWIIVSYVFDHTDYAIVNFHKETLQADENRSIFTFATANVLLAIDILGKFQNMSLSYGRARRIGQKIVQSMTSSPLVNHAVLDDKKCDIDSKLDSVVRTDLPQVDFFCFQEVFDRCFATILISQLKSKYNHFVVDVAQHRLSGQLCLGSSGLMMASRYPFLKVHFHKFQTKGSKFWMKLIDYGVLMAKLDLGLTQNGCQRVGFLANLHMIAYQGKENLVGKCMNEVRHEFAAFRQKNTLQGEKCLFAVVSGDFNIDNISPADNQTRDNLLFTEYIDYPMAGPGHDKCWSVGTELRQMKMYEPELSSAENMKKVMLDRVARRHFLIDADVKEQTMDLMYCGPEPDDDGQVRERPETGGRRRIDRILYDSTCGNSRPSGYGFSSIFHNHSDHIPVVMSIEVGEKVRA